MIRPKMDYAEVMWSAHKKKKKVCVEIGNNTENNN